MNVLHKNHLLSFDWQLLHQDREEKINLPPLLCIWKEIQHYFVVLWPLLLIPGADGDFTQSLSPCVCQDSS